MTDKEQIIIDGINVVDCNYIIDHDPPKTRGTWGGTIHKGACKIYSKDCKHNPDCYFKQLTLKTQECEALKSESFTMNSLIIEQEEEIDRYRKVLEKIEKLISDDEFAKCPIDGENCNYFTSRKILDIINKAKGAEDER